MELADKIAVVTGGGSGIGKAVAERFVAEGAHAVIVADLNEDTAVAAAEAIGPKARGVGLDVADEDAIKALVEDVESNQGPIDVFFSNAGYGKGGGLELSNEDWMRMMDVHLWSHLYAARAVVPSMIANGGGYIVNTASAAGLLSQMDSGPYAVSKHAAVAFAEWLSINYGDQGIRVTSLCPQAVRTNILGDPALWEKRTEKGGQASQDGILLPEELAEILIQTMRDETFLCLPHPMVETYMQRKTGDYDRWLNGMRRFRAKLESMKG